MAPQEEAKNDAKSAGTEKKTENELEPDEANIPVVEEPDKKASDDNLEKLQKKIDDAQAELKKVADLIGVRCAGNSDFLTKRFELLTKVTAEKERIDEHMAKKKEIESAIELKNKERNDLKDMRKKLEYSGIAEIDRRIREIEGYMIHSSLTLNEEKKYMLEIAQLKKQKLELTKYIQLERAYCAAYSFNNSLSEQRHQINEVMNVHRERKIELNAEFTALLAERDAQMGNSQEMYRQRDELNNKVKEYTRERNALRDPFQNMAHKAQNVLVLTIFQLDGSNHKIDNLCPDDLVDDLYRVVGEVLQIPAPNLTLVVGTTALPNFSGQPLHSVGLTSQASVIAIRNKVLYLGYSDAAVAELLMDDDDFFVMDMDFWPDSCCEDLWEYEDSEPSCSPACRLMCKDERTWMFETARSNKSKPQSISSSRVDRMDRKIASKQRRIHFRHKERLCCAPNGCSWDAESRSEMKRHKRYMTKCKRYMEKRKERKSSPLAFEELEDS